MMDNQPGATPVRLIMAQAPNSGIPSSEQYVQLPSMQQLVSPNGKQTLMQPMLSPPQAENQTVVHLPSMQQLISQTAKPVQLQQMISPQGDSQTVVQQSATVGAQQMFPGHMGMPSVFSKYRKKTKHEPAHEILVLFILHKLILQTRMCSHPVGLDA